MESTGAAASADKMSGLPSMLEDEEKRILVGWVFHNYLKGDVVQKKHAVDFINDVFGVEVSAQTAGAYLNELEMGVRTSQKKSAGFPVDKDYSSLMVLNWLEKHLPVFTEGLKTLPPSVSGPPPSLTTTTTTTRSASAILGAKKCPNKRSREMDRSRLASVILSCKGRRTETILTYAPRGQSQPRVCSGVTKYTNRILT